MSVSGRKIFFLFALIFSRFYLVSESNKFSFDVSSFFGIKYGEISKTLYFYDKDTKVSHLDWEEKPVYEFGIGTNLGFYNFGINIKFSAGLPVNCGTMHDYDWNLDGLNITYSKHECDIVQSFDTELFFHYKTPRFFIFQINPMIGVQYMYQNFSAHDGYGWYGARKYAKEPRSYDVAWNDPLARKAKKLREIDYYRHTFLTFFGFEIETTPTEKIHFAAGFFISPIGYMYSLDTHHHESEGIHYLDVQNAIFSKFKTTFQADFHINKKMSVTLGFAYLFGSKDFGDLYSDHYSDNLTKFDDQPTSSNIYNIDVDISFKYKVK